MDLDEELGVYVPPGELEEMEDAQFEELMEEEEELNP
jgi:hypothetical protein